MQSIKNQVTYFINKHWKFNQNISTVKGFFLQKILLKTYFHILVSIYQSILFGGLKKLKNVCQIV